MSYFNTNSLGWYHYQHDPGINPCRFPRVESEPTQDTFPPDFEKGWEYYKHFHLCYFCHEQGHEDEMSMYDHYYWAHKSCLDKREQLLKSFNHESEDHKERI